MNTLLILLLCLSGARGGSAKHSAPERVDLIELNHICAGGNAKCILLRQVIVWGWNAEHQRRDVRAYFILSPGDLEPYPVGGGRWQYRYRHWGHWHTIESQEYAETATVGDPEQANRRLCPQELRVPLVGQAAPRMESILEE